MACAVLALCGKSRSIYCKSRSIASLSIASQHKRHCLLLFCRAYLWGPFVSQPVMLFSLGHFSITLSLVGLLALVCFLWNLSRYSLWRPIPNEPPSALFFACFKYRGRKGSHSIGAEQTFCILFLIIDSLSPFSRPCIVINFSTNTIR